MLRHQVAESSRALQGGLIYRAMAAMSHMCNGGNRPRLHYQGQDEFPAVDTHPDNEYTGSWEESNKIEDIQTYSYADMSICSSEIYGGMGGFI